MLSRLFVVSSLLVSGTLLLGSAGAASHHEVPATAAGCRTAVDTAIQDYMAARRLALLQCHSDTNEGRLRPCDCETEARTAAALADAQRVALRTLHRSCSDATVTAAPPEGIGARICGEDAACGFAVLGLDDGTRGDGDDYVDCLLCLANDAVKAQIDAVYDGLTSADPPARVRQCRTRFTQAIIAFDSRRRRLESRCPGCTKTADRVSAAQTKIAARLLAACRTDTNTAVSETPATSPAAPPQEARTARKP